MGLLLLDLQSLKLQAAGKFADSIPVCEDGRFLTATMCLVTNLRFWLRVNHKFLSRYF